VGVRTFLEGWPVYRQLTGNDPLGLGESARSRWSDEVTARTREADRVVDSVCPYCAVGCAQRV
jgi:formate dehydrogenase major subunit